MSKLDPLQLVLMGKGPHARLKHVPCPNSWRGMSAPSNPPFDPAQAKLNRESRQVSA